MNKDLILQAKTQFQQELRKFNDKEYPALPSQNAGLVLLYAKMLELEQQLAELQQAKGRPANASYATAVS